MTQIDFFSNAPDRVDYVARLMQKVQRKGQTAIIFGQAEVLKSLSTSLWQSEGFLAHELVLDEIQRIDNIAPFILTAHACANLPHHELLINLSDTQPEFFAQFERLIEVVPNEDAPKQLARDRWQSYKNRGYVMKHHDIASLKK